MSSPQARRPHWMLLLALAATIAAALWPADDPAATDLLPERRATGSPAGRIGAGPAPLGSTARPIIDPPAAAVHPKLRPALDETAGLTLFGDAALPAAARPVAPAPPAPQPAASDPEPVAPTPGVTARGLMRERGQPLRALLETPAGELVVLSAGQALDAAWRVDAVTAEQVVFLHLPTQTRLSAPVPNEP